MNRLFFSGTENEILISTDGTHFNDLDTRAAGIYTYQAKGLTPGTSYTFEVTAMDADYNESTPFNVASATTVADPWNVHATGNDTVNEGGVYALNFWMSPSTGAPAFGEWAINWGDGSAVQDVYTANSIVSHTFASGTAFSSINASAETASGASSPLMVTAPAIGVSIIPAAPTNLIATAVSSTEIDLSWTNNSLAATGINVLRSDDGGATFNLIDTVDPDVDTYADTSLSPNQTAQYEVQATCDASGQSSGGGSGSGSSGSGGSSGSSGGGSTTSGTAGSSSVTTTSGTPTFNVSAGVTGSDTAVLTWGYQGNDDAGFEIEMEDASIGENYHTILTPAALNSGGNASATVNLIGGDDYLFRMRADHTDGTVSSYVGGGLSVPIAGPPSLNAATVDGAVQVSWSDAPGNVVIEVQGSAFPGTSQWYYTAGAGDYYFPSDDSGSGSVDNLGVAGTGDYSYRIRSFDQYGNPTKWSGLSQVSYTDPGPDPSPITPQVSPTDTTITASWPKVDGESSGLIMQQYGIDAEIGYYSAMPIPSLNADGTQYVAVTENLHPGTEYDFVLATSNRSGTVYSKATTVTTGAPTGTPPAAPAFGRSIYDPSVPGGQIKLSWANTPNNETGYVIYRVTAASDGSGALHLDQVGSTGADDTSYTVKNLSDDGPYSFRIYSKNAAGNSKDYASTACAAIGGPDITAHLIAIRSDLMKFQSNVNGFLYMKEIFFDERDPIDAWDINPLALQQVQTPRNRGILPDGTTTVTIDGHVYAKAEVNYWLFGIWVAIVGEDYSFALSLVTAHAATTKEGVVGKIAWFNAGYNDRFSDAVSAAIPSVAPAGPPPYNKLLDWYLGSQHQIHGSD